MRSSSLLAVDCGARHAAIGRLVADATGRFSLVTFASAGLPVPAADEAGWVRAITAAVEGLAVGARLRGRCIVGLPGHVTLHRTIRVPVVSARRRRSILRFEASQCLPGGGADVRWWARRVASDPEGELTVITAAHAATLAGLSAGLAQAGLLPIAMLPSWLVLRDGLRSRQPAAAGALGAGVGARSTEVVLVGDDRFLVRTLALGGESVTQAVAEHLHVTAERAEEIKLRAGAASAPGDGPESMAVQLAADQFFRRLDGELRRSLAGIGPAGDPRRPAILHLSGGGSLLSGLPRALETSLGLRVERWKDPDRTGSDTGSVATVEAGHRMELICLAECAAGGRSPNAGLLPNAARRRAMVRRWWPALAAAAVLAILAPLLGIRRARVATESRRHETSELAAKIAARQRLLERNRAVRGRLAEVNERLAAVQRLARARCNWVRLAEELQARLARVGDAWVEAMQPVPEMPTRGRTQPAGASPAKRAAAAMRETGPHLRLTVCLFDPEQPGATPGEGAYRRARLWLRELRDSPYVAAIGDERFEVGQPGVLRVEATLELASGRMF